MSIFKKVNERRILHTPLEPPSTSWLWLKTEDGVSTLYDFVNGKWTPVGGYTEDYEHDNHDSEWGGDQQQNSSYVTWDSLNGKVDEIYSTVETWLSGYLKEADFSNYITKDELSSAVSSSMSGVLKDYQPLLRAGQSITITAVAARGLDRETDERVMSSLISVKMGAIGPSKKDPISGATAYTEFQSVYRALNNKQATLYSGSNIKTINNTSLLGGGNLAVQAPINDLATIRSGAAAGATSVQNSEFVSKLEDELKQIKIGANAYSLVGNGTITIPSNGGSSNVAVDVLYPNDPVPAEQGIYFFADSPSQVEGDYNSLLQSINGTIGDYTFSPGTLYSLVPAKRVENLIETGFLGFNVVGQITDNNVVNNEVYYENEKTLMKYYGDIVVSNTIKIADTSDTAIIHFLVACPFAADSTTVTISYNTTDVDIQYLKSDNNWQNLPSDGFTFSNTGKGKRVTLKVIRKDTSYNTKKIVEVALNNGYEDTVVTVMYPSTRVFFNRTGWVLGNATTVTDYINSIKANNAKRIETLTVAAGSGSIVDGNSNFFYVGWPTDLGYVSLSYNGEGTLSATVKVGTGNAVSTSIVNNSIQIGTDFSSDVTLAITASKTGKRSKTFTVTWKSGYSRQLDCFLTGNLRNFEPVIPASPSTSNPAYLYLPPLISRNLYLLMPNIVIDRSKFNTAYVCADIKSNRTWIDIALYSKDWYGRFANEVDNGDRKRMYCNSFYLPNTGERNEKINDDIDHYGYWRGRCYCRSPRIGGSTTCNMYLEYMFEAGKIYEFGIITIDPSDFEEL